MPRRRRNDDDDVSLFPFLSIIACVIGVLTMMISTLALAQMDGDEIEVIEAWELSQKQLDQADAELARLMDSIAQQLGPDGADIQLALRNRQRELDQLTAQQEQLQRELDTQRESDVVIPTIDESLRESVASMQAELTALQEELAQMELELQERKESSQTRVSILPSGSGLRMTPHFVECGEGSLTLHTQDPPKLIRAANMVTDQDFLDVLKTVANSADDTIIFLIRPEGLNTFRAAKRLCDEGELRHGKLPVAGGGRIDLSRFSKAGR